MYARAPQSVHAAGFTLVEMLIALTIMAVMAGLSWQGLDAMSKSRQLNQVHHQQVLTLSTGLAQWGTDLDALTNAAALPSIEFGGSWLRMVRRSALHDAASEALVVVAYAQQADPQASNGQDLQWLRWQSEPATTVAQLQARWLAAKAWHDGLSEGPQNSTLAPAVQLARIHGWRLAVAKDGAWQPVSMGSLSMPPALRLELDLSQDQPLYGTVRRDWIAPNAGGTR
jgi:general secretion pathway protein J